MNFKDLLKNFGQIIYPALVAFLTVWLYPEASISDGGLPTYSRTYEIGSWNMVIDDLKSIEIDSLSVRRINSISVLIRADNDSAYFHNFDVSVVVHPYHNLIWFENKDATFDASFFSDKSVNRGFVTIEYIKL